MVHVFAPLGACALVAVLACACTVQAGLANAPQLGGAATGEPGVHDAIANGPDSCGRKLDPGPIRNRVIPCPRASHPRSTSPSAALPVESDPTVMQWLQHYHAHWPCPEDVGRPLAIASGAACPGVGHDQ